MYSNDSLSGNTALTYKYSIKIKLLFVITQIQSL